MQTRRLTQDEVVDRLSTIFHRMYPDMEYDFSDIRHPIAPGLIVRHTFEGSDYVGEIKMPCNADIFKLAEAIVSHDEEIMYDGEGPKKKFVPHSF